MSNQTITLAESYPFPSLFLLIEVLLCQSFCESLNLHSSFQQIFTEYLLRVRYRVNKMKLLALQEIKFLPGVTDIETDKMLSCWKMPSDTVKIDMEQRKGALECGWRWNFCSRPWRIQSLCRKVMQKITVSCRVTCGPGKPNRKLVSPGCCGWLSSPHQPGTTASFYPLHFRVMKMEWVLHFPHLSFISHWDHSRNFWVI